MSHDTIDLDFNLQFLSYLFMQIFNLNLNCNYYAYYTIFFFKNLIMYVIKNKDFGS